MYAHEIIKMICAYAYKINLRLRIQNRPALAQTKVRCASASQIDLRLRIQNDPARAHTK